MFCNLSMLHYIPTANKTIRTLMNFQYAGHSTGKTFMHVIILQTCVLVEIILSRRVIKQRKYNRQSLLSEKFRLLRTRRERTSTAEVESGRMREGGEGEGGMGKSIV